MHLARLGSLVLAGSMMLAARPAAADEPYAPAAWGVLVGELATAGVFAANFNDVWPGEGPALMLNFTPMVLGPAAAFGAYYGGLDARPALSLHGAGWMGLEGFMLGSLIDGRDESWGLRAGKFAWTLGAVGAIAGGVIGATAVDGKTETATWLVPPIVGFGGGGLVLGGLLVLIGQIDGDDAPGQFVTGAVIGLGLGLGAATFLAYRGIGDTSPSRLKPTVTGPALSDNRATIISFGGAF
jgi:hypothetical protein